MERLGLGPDTALAQNPRLIYGRMTGYGQDGPLRGEAGHDITYSALSGALSMIGTAERQVAPLNLVADFGGGGMLLVVGVLAALQERASSGRSQVIDAAMTDGAALLTTMFHGYRAAGRWVDQRASNPLDGGAPYYNIYRCACGGWIAVGAIEPQFYAALIGLLGLTDDPPFSEQLDRARWPDQEARLRAVFQARSRDDGCAAALGCDACLSPILTLAEVADHPAHRARDAFVTVAGVVQPAPAPRFGRTPLMTPAPGRFVHADTAGPAPGDDRINPASG